MLLLASRIPASQASEPLNANAKARKEALIEKSFRNDDNQVRLTIAFEVGGF